MFHIQLHPSKLVKVLTKNPLLTFSEMANYNNKEDNKKEAIRKRSNGRRKIPIETITDPTRKHVTFSKRRLGLFKKASELCALCGVEMAIFTFSERGKLFCFGHPNSEYVIQRYLSCGSCCLKEQDEHEFDLMVEEQSRQHEEIKRKTDEKKRLTYHYDVEKNKLAENDVKNKKGCGFWWEEATISEMGLNELEQFMACLTKLRDNVAMKADDLTGCAPLGSSPIGKGFDKIHDIENPVLGVMSSNSSHLIAVEDRDANVDIVSRSFKLRFLNEVHMTNEIKLEGGQDITHFSNLSQRMEVFNFAVMNQYHQLPVSEDHKGTLTNPGDVPHQGFRFGDGRL